MNSCADIQADLSPYIDGEIPAAHRVAIEEHLASCPDCRQRVAELREQVAGVKALPALQPSPQFLREVRAKVAASRPAERSPHVVWWGVPLGAAAMLALLVTANFLLRAPTRNEASAPAGTTAGRSFTGTIFSKDEAASMAEAKAKDAVASNGERLSDRSETRGLTESLPAEVDSRKLIPPATSLPQKEREEFAKAPRALSAPTITAPPPEQMLVVTGKDAKVLRQRAHDLAKTLSGTVTNDADSDTLYVQLPANKVAEFKSRLSNNEVAAAADKVDARSDVLAAGESFRQVVLQIQIITNTAPSFASPGHK